jgi:large subunit ribosomal protein L23
MTTPATKMVLKPRMSEKAYGMSQERNTYVFVVPDTANKVTVAAAIADEYSVTVEQVNISILKGKVKRSYRRGGRPIKGRTTDVKKAYVRVKEGDIIPVFAAMEEEDAKAEKTAETLKKAADKKAKKDKKETK